MHNCIEQDVACHEPMPAVHTPVWRVGAETEGEEALARATGVVRDGGVIIYPTETFYGLGCHPGLPSAIEKIYRIKGRDFRKPLPLIAADAAAVRMIAAAWSDEADRLARAFWPGPLTMVIRVRDLPPSASLGSSYSISFDHIPLSPMVHAFTGKIAVRVSSHPLAAALASGVGGFVASTSANFSGEAPCADPDRMPCELLNAVDGLLHAGKLAGRMPSTIVDVSSGPPRLVRAGRISWEKIDEALRT